MSLAAHTGATNTLERKATNNKNDLNTRGFDLVCFFVHRKKQSYKELFFVKFCFIRRLPHPNDSFAQVMYPRSLHQQYQWSHPQSHERLHPKL
jgi:hypothetical protein